MAKGAGTLKSNCSSNMRYHVNNIEEVGMDFVEAGYAFSVHHDHSKWAVTKSFEGFFGIGKGALENAAASYDVQVACVGDINRQEDQMKRGGGTVCFTRNANVWREYGSLVRQIQECDHVQVAPGLKKWKKVKFTVSGEMIVPL